MECVDERPTPLNCSWDEQILRTAVFETWLDSVDVVVWTHLPTSREIGAAREARKQTIVIPMWHELQSNSKKVLQAVDAVVCPHTSLSNVFRRWPSIRTHYVPWCPGTPLTSRAGLRSDGCVHALVAMFDQAPKYVETTFIDELVRILDALPCVHFTLAYASSQMKGHSLNRLRGLHKRYGDRFALARGVAVRNRPLLYARHDVTLWPSCSEDIGLVGLESLSMGTPVLGWKVPPFDEFLTCDGAQLVSCTVHQSPIGVCSAEGNFYKFGVAAQQLLSDPARIVKMQQACYPVLKTRQQEFVEFWRSAFDDA